MAIRFLRNKRSHRVEAFDNSNPVESSQLTRLLARSGNEDVTPSGGGSSFAHLTEDGSTLTYDGDAHVTGDLTVDGSSPGFAPQVFEVTDLLIPEGTSADLVIAQFDANPLDNFVASFAVVLNAPLPSGPALTLAVSPSADHGVVLAAQLTLQVGNTWAVLPLVDGFGFEGFSTSTDPVPVDIYFETFEGAATTADIHVPLTRAAFLPI